MSSHEEIFEFIERPAKSPNNLSSAIAWPRGHEDVVDTVGPGDRFNENHDIENAPRNHE